MTAAIHTSESNLQILIDSGRSAEDLSALAHQIYEAVAEPQNWSGVVGAIAQSLNAHCGCLFTPYARPQQGGFVFPWQMDESHVLLWGTKYIDLDVWSQSASEKGLWQEGEILVDEQLVPRDVLARSVFYREFLTTMNIGRVCAGVLLGGAPGLPTTCLSVYRPFDSPAFSPAEVAWFRLLVPHLSRALGLLHHLDALRVQNSSLLAAFDRLNFGACLLDETGSILHMNPSASSALSRGDGLLLDSQNGLAGMSRANSNGQPSDSLKNWIANQLSNSALIGQPIEHFSSAFLQTRTEPGKFYSLQASFLPASFSSVGAKGARMVVFITDPDAVQMPTAERVADLYGLTRSQARVAIALGRGNSYKEIARDLSVSSNTIATHVKEVYARVKVNRQADLMRHIMALGEASV